MHELTVEQKKKRLTECENEMRSNLYGFRKFEEMAIEIATDRLYEALDFPTFLSYYTRHWAEPEKLSRRKYYLLKYAEIVADVAAGNSLVQNEIEPGQELSTPATERQARELSVFEPEGRASVWQAAVQETGKPQPSAAEVRATAAAFKTTDERISRLDTGRGPKATPPSGEKPFLRKSFQVSEFKYDPASDKFQFMVFKPANPYKGWESKREYLSITRSDMMWEFNNLGFELTRKGAAEGDADGASACEAADAPREEIDADDLAMTPDLPADIDSGARALVAKERRRIAAIHPVDMFFGEAAAT